MAVLDFLFQGSPPANATSTTESTTATPAWYQEYLRGLLSKGSAIAADPYTQYEGARVAGFTPEQTTVFGQVAALPETGGTPTYGQAVQTIGQGTEGSALSAAQPYAAAASAPSYSNVQSYTSPYTSAVTDEIARLGTRNFNENIMPGVQNSFIAAGQYGSGRNAEILGRAARDTQADISGKQAAALESGYTGALSAAGTDAARQAALASTMGTTAGQDLSRDIAGGTALTAVGQSQQDAALKNAAALQAVGQQGQALGQQNLDVAYQDFINQRDWDKTQSNYMSSLIRGTAAPASTTTTASTAPYAGATQSPLSTILGTANLISGLKKGGLVKSKGALSGKGK